MTRDEEIRRRIRGEAPAVPRAEAAAMLTGRAPEDAERAYTDGLRHRRNEGREPEGGRCPDTTDGQHGPADGAGICPWCGAKYTYPKPRPRGFPVLVTDLEEAYRRVYDPDFWG